MKIEITNRQKIKRINLKGLRKKLTNVGAGKRISFVLCDNKFIKKLNKKYFRKSCPTDVIAFPLNDNLDPDYLGEIVVSVEEAVNVGAAPCGRPINKGQAHRPAPTWQDELILYCIHGILHLTGYDDRTKKQRERMEKKQEEILRKL